jgi:hypothetical protein
MALRYRVRFPAAILSVIAAGVFQLLIPRLSAKRSIRIGNHHAFAA